MKKTNFHKMFNILEKPERVCLKFVSLKKGIFKFKEIKENIITINNNIFSLFVQTIIREVIYIVNVKVCISIKNNYSIFLRFFH